MSDEENRTPSDNEEELSDAEEETPAVVGEKRGRGRPPKGPNAKKAVPYVPTGRPRGRPTKASKKRGRHFGSGDAASAEKPKSAYVPTGKPRGRPKKAQKEEAQEDD